MPDEELALEDRFHKAMLSIYEDAKRELGYNATRFLRMVGERGGPGAAHQLLLPGHIHDGLGHLLERGRPDLTVEALVQHAEFRSLFTEAEIDEAVSRIGLFEGESPT